MQPCMLGSVYNWTSLSVVERGGLCTLYMWPPWRVGGGTEEVPQRSVALNCLVNYLRSQPDHVIHVIHMAWHIVLWLWLMNLQGSLGIMLCLHVSMCMLLTTCPIIIYHRSCSSTSNVLLPCAHVQGVKYCICGNFHQEKIFANFAICSHWQNLYHANFLSCVNDYIEDLATFTALAKIYSIKYFCNTKVSGLGEVHVCCCHCCCCP